LASSERFSIIEHLRYKGYGHSVILPHRAFAQLQLARLPFLRAAGLAAAALFTWSLLLPRVMQLWIAILHFWAMRLGLNVDLGFVKYHGLWMHFNLPFLRAVDTVPVNRTLVFFCLVLGAGLLLSIKIPEKLLPVRYLARAVILVQATGVSYFFVRPNAFPHNTTDYSLTLIKSSLAFVTLVPVILALTYYIFNFGVIRKCALTVLIMLHLVIFVPHQYVLTVYLLQTFSLVVMPVLYQFCGVLLNVTVFIGLYSWGMSWKTKRTEEI
jgi:hypothetical protein